MSSSSTCCMRRSTWRACKRVTPAVALKSSSAADGTVNCHLKTASKITTGISSQGPQHLYLFQTIPVASGGHGGRVPFQEADEKEDASCRGRSRSLFLRLLTTRFTGSSSSFVKKEKCIGAKSNLYRSTINKKKFLATTSTSICTMATSIHTEFHVINIGKFMYIVIGLKLLRPPRQRLSKLAIVCRMTK